MDGSRTAEELEEEKQELLRRIDAAERRADAAERRRADEEQRAAAWEEEEQELLRRIDEVRRETDELRQQTDEVRRQTQPTTLDEYIAACHSLLFSKLTVGPRPKLTSKGPITNPQNKWCPTNLRPWSNFLQQQRIAFGTLYNAFPTNRRVFDSQSLLSQLGQKMSKRVIRDEGRLSYFMNDNVMDSVKSIIAELKEVEEARMAFDLGNGILLNPGCVYRSDNAVASDRAAPSCRSMPNEYLQGRGQPEDDSIVRGPRRAFPVSCGEADCAGHYGDLPVHDQGGLEYGVLTTGEAIAFLKVDWREPETLFYHLAEPDAEVAAHPNHFRLCTAVGQYLAFSLMALGPAGGQRLPGQEERRQATENLKTWNEDFETTLRSIPEDERNAPKSSPVSEYWHNRPENKEEREEQATTRSKEGHIPNNHHGHDTGPGRALARHPIDHAEFLELLRQQLERTLDDGITPLGPSGACGVLFRVTLLAYCYTFVSKGTFRAFVKDLEHEAAVYRRLQPIQGRHVPVFLGAIDLRSMNKIYYYGYRAYVIHMTFLSWGGNYIDLAIADGAEGELEGAAVRSLRAIHQLGVRHKDIRRPNMLFNAEINGVLIIDFERSLLLSQRMLRWLQAVPNKRKREVEKSDHRGRAIAKFSDEIWMLRGLFRNP
ncbi:uncharacterized protein E0L32_008283 [Thyridium curvatum]|uniref:Protein kinase domain-containing protein n=1 Tax=Thyridium curvatum TaxID=1093900 RepID=A0A507AW61_9PEZI|nr:uncharacterized protein E0L32_008283 [Thyridium curvatum]TPX10714.1 hypothetical protein E0L32_008283 [Thyridium curvatum]